MNHSVQRSVVIILIPIILIMSVLTASAQAGPVQRLEINDTDASAWPTVAVYASATDANRDQLAPEDVTVQVFEDDRPVTAGVDVTTEPTGLAAVILLDLSGSMAMPGMEAATRFEDAKAAALEFVNTQLTDGDLVGVIGFASRIRDENKLMLTLDRAQAAELISAMQPETDPQEFNTALWEAAFNALWMFDQHPDAAIREQAKRMRRAVVIFSDGNDTASQGANPPDLVWQARDLQTAFHTVGLDSPRQSRYPAEQKDVKWLADQTFGEFFNYKDDARRAALPAFLGRLAGQRDQLRISYPSRGLNGQHTTRIVVSTGNTSQEAQRTWSGGGCKLAARITEPAAGTAYGCSPKTTVAPVAVEAACADGAPRPVDRVEFYDNGVLFGADTTPPYIQDWDPRTAKVGNHELKAVVHDAALGELVITEPLAVSVSPPVRPEISLVSPAAGSEIQRDKTSLVPIEAEVIFPDECLRSVVVRVNVDGNQLPDADLSSAPYRVQWDISKAAPGEHQISLEIVDSATERSQSITPVTVSIADSQTTRILHWLKGSWYVPALALGFLLLLVLLLRTRRQVGKAVRGTAAKMRETFIGRPAGGDARGALQAIRGPDQGRTFTLNERVNTVGRDAQACEVVVRDDGWLSGKHFRIEFADSGEIMLTDIGSRHGTAVNGQPIAPNQPVALHGGERIRAGESEFEFRLPSRRETRIVPRR